MTIRTQYGNGRNKLNAPSISITTGAISGGNLSYRFWVKARNRVGYNIESNVTAVTLGANSGFIINSSTFSSFAYEDWREILVFMSTTANFSDSRVIYKQKLYQSDDLTPVTLSNITITNNYVINGSFNIEDTDSFPDSTNLPNGYRLNVLSNSKTYEYIKDNNLVADGINTFAAVNGIWSIVKSNSLTELTSTYRKELFEVTGEELFTASLNDSLSDSVPIKYYLLNSAATSLPSGELTLNEYCSDSSIQYDFDVKILGYFNYTTNTLDTSGITYVNTNVSYPDTKIELTKALPANSALVIEVKPNLELVTAIPEGIFITIYPKLNDYSVLKEITYWSTPVEDIASLKAVPSSAYKHNQIRFVASVNRYFSFNSTSTASDDGDTVLIPNNNPVTGRWLAISNVIANGSITPDKLATDTLELIEDKIKTTTVTINSGSNYTINLDDSLYDNFIVNCPLEDGVTTNINVTATLANNETKAIAIELRQKTGAVVFNNSLIFPGGNTPVFSGNNKTDLFVVKLTKDSTGMLKKRIFLVQKDIG